MDVPSPQKQECLTLSVWNCPTLLVWSARPVMELWLAGLVLLFVYFAVTVIGTVAWALRRAESTTDTFRL
jgi:hypothetical protein